LVNKGMILETWLINEWF